MTLWFPSQCSRDGQAHVPPSDESEQQTNHEYGWLADISPTAFPHQAMQGTADNWPNEALQHGGEIMSQTHTKVEQANA